MSIDSAPDPRASFPLGPVQMLVVGFDDDEFTGRILPELERLRELDVVRLVDLLVVRKDEAGELDVHQATDVDHDEAVAVGALISALVGLGTGSTEEMRHAAIAGAAELEYGHVLDDEAVWYLSDAIPPGNAAAVALIEHRWAIPLRDRIVEAGGFALADEWIHPADLVAVAARLGAAQAR